MYLHIFNTLLGSCFVRTDQLDGETDWKLRVAVTSCQQRLHSDQVGVHDEHYILDKHCGDFNLAVWEISLVCQI